MKKPIGTETAARAAESLGTSGKAIYQMVAEAIRAKASVTGVICDIGCGTGSLRRYISDFCQTYIGVDAVRYIELKDDCQFIEVDLDSPSWPIDDALADVAVSVETIEHLENPRAFFRELIRITKPGGLVVVTTPNQESWLSLLTLVLKGQFNAFQEKPGLYPAHRTALLEIDLLRIANEVGLTQVEMLYTHTGRIPWMSRHWPSVMGRRGRRYSDNLALVGTVPLRN